MAGDLNIDSKQANFEYSQLTLLLKSYNLVNLVTEYTQVVLIDDSSITKKSIDYVITNLDGLVQSCSNVVNTIKSDHEGQLLVFLGNKKSTIKIRQINRSLKGKNIEKLSNSLGGIDWKDTLDKESTSERK